MGLSGDPVGSFFEEPFRPLSELGLLCLVFVRTRALGAARPNWEELLSSSSSAWRSPFCVGSSSMLWPALVAATSSCSKICQRFPAYQIIHHLSSIIYLSSIDTMVMPRLQFRTS